MLNLVEMAKQLENNFINFIHDELIQDQYQSP